MLNLRSMAFGTLVMLLASPIFAQPSNDLCSNAQVINTQGPVAGTLVGATGTDLTPGCASGDTQDVWYRIPAGANPRQVDLSIVADDDETCMSLAAFTHCPTAPLDGVFACETCSRSIGFVSSPGQDIWIRVSAEGAPIGFTLTASFKNVTHQPGDLCSAPISISPGTSRSGTLVGFSGNTGYIGFPSSRAVPAAGTIDAWYQLIVGPADAGMYRIDTRGSTMDTTLTLYQTCSAPAPNQGRIAYQDNLQSVRPVDACGDPFDSDSEMFVVLTPGAYLIRVADSPYFSGGVVGPYVLNVSNPSSAIPGDVCENALPILADTIVTGNTTNLTGFDRASSCVQNDRIDIWFAFTPTRSGVYVIDTLGSAFDTTLGVYDDCTLPSIYCNDDSAFSTAAEAYAIFNAGQTYYIRLAGFSCFTGAYQMIIKSPPVNDDCPNALPISGGSVSGTIRPSFDIWYSFTPATSAWYAFSTTADFDPSLTLFDSCSGQPIAFNNDIAFGSGNRQSQVEAQLTAGQSYFVLIRLVDFFSTQTTSSAVGSFTIDVTQKPLPAATSNDLCTSALPIASGFSGVVDARRATQDSGVASCSLLQGGSDTLAPYGIWFLYQPVGSGEATFQHTGLSRSTVRCYKSPTNSCTNLVPVLNQTLNAIICSDTGTIRWSAQHGESYYILVHTTDGGQPISPYAVNVSLAGNSGSCCSGAACVVNTQAACQAAGGTYLGDSSACLAPSGSNTTPTPIAQSASTTFPITVSGAPSALTSIDVYVDLFRARAGNVDLTITSPSGTTATLVNGFQSNGTCAQPVALYYILAGAYTFSDSAPITIYDGVITTGVAPDYVVDAGRYRPFNCATGSVSLNAAFAGQNPNGVWTISVFVRQPTNLLENGTLRSARLYINGGAGDPCAPACQPDFDSDGNLTVQDIFGFLNAWFSSLPTADFDASGSLGVTDIFEFLNAWFTGC